MSLRARLRLLRAAGDELSATLRRAHESDLGSVASWLRSASECRLWSGDRVAFPVDLERLPRAIEYDACESWVLVEEDRVVAFGQLVPKPSGSAEASAEAGARAEAAGRLHLARLIAAPDRRREGLGRRISAHLLALAVARRPRAISLNVAADDPAARALYESLGFAAATRPDDEPRASSIYMEYRA